MFFTPLLITAATSILASIASAAPCARATIYRRAYIDYVPIQLIDCKPYDGNRLCSKTGSKADSPTKCINPSKSSETDGCGWTELMDPQYNRDTGLEPFEPGQNVFKMTDEGQNWTLNITNASTEKLKFNPKDLGQWWKNSANDCFAERKNNVASCKIISPEGSGNVYFTIKPYGDPNWN